ncbi:hypothetical protein [Streptomyces sp. NBC_01465]|uniref:hypothetical protein n=1 Tax=Streptomyces sp. NBC_01465 TaxID=2903878 RepID=UPI002E30A198|nr:hypothetical protein [Streptomyces sp. NBC_01465]
MLVRQYGWRSGACGASVAVVIAAVAGCSPRAGAVADDRSDTGAVQGAAAALVRAGSAKARTSMEMASGGTRVTISGTGTYDFRKRMGMLRVVLPQDAAGAQEHRPITELLAPSALYMKNRGAGVPADKWVRVDTRTLSDGNLVTGGATDPLIAAELLRGARKVSYVGKEELDGVRVRHYRGVTAAAKGFAKRDVPFDAYLDDEGRLRKVRHRFSFVNEGKTVEVASTTVLYGFGAPVAVELPAAADIYAGKIR